MTRPLELVFSPCPNDAFIFHAWAAGLVPGAPPVRVRHADVDEANELAARGVPDVVKVSYAALPHLLGAYRLLRAGGAVGSGCGPLLLTAGRPAPRPARVAIPGRRTTAYLLYRLWAAEQPAGPLREPRSIDVLPFPEIMPAVRTGRYEAGLVIHEARFTYPEYGLTCVADLGEWWEEQTGLPIPLGAILARRSLDADIVTAAIRASVDRAWADPGASEDYVRSLAQDPRPDVTAAHIRLYVNASTRALTEADDAAIRTLLSRAAARGLVPDISANALG